MITRTNFHWRGATGRSSLVAAAVALVMSSAACSIDDLLTVSDPDVASPGSLTGEASLPAILAGARSDFQLSYGGSSGAEGQVVYTGLFTDELQFVESFDTRLQIDKRDIRIDNGNVETVFRNVMRARTSAEVAAERFAEFDADAAGHATALNLAGFSYILVAENYCSGIPFSRLTAGGETEYGVPETTAQIFQRAVDRFTEARAIALDAGDDDETYLASVGLGRAYVGLGQFGNAAAAVAGVPDDFVYVSEHSENTSRQYNGVYNYTHTARRFGVSNNEAGEGLPFRAANDPRVPWVQQGTAWDGQQPLFRQLKYPSRSADVAIASGIEARLIEAEAALKGAGGAAAMYLILNALRDDIGLLPLTPQTGVAAENDLFYERAFWLYLTAHRLGDLRRLARPVSAGGYGRSVDTVFPSGEYYKQGQSYGTDVAFPLPTDETGNPNYQACDVTQP